jgi:hypothetical protein
MSVFTPVGILLFSSLIAAFSGLTSGVFMIFYHSALGRMSRRRASDYALFYILGVETTLTILLFCLYIIFNVSLGFSAFCNSDLFNLIFAGLIAAEGIMYLTLYFRRGRGTKLYISRNVAKRYCVKAAAVKSRSDAFMLGQAALLPELIFILPVLIVAILTVGNFGPTPPARAGLLLLFVIISICPLLLLHFCFTSGRNISDLLRFRYRYKSFFRFMVVVFYFLVAMLMILRNVL